MIDNAVLEYIYIYIKQKLNHSRRLVNKANSLKECIQIVILVWLIFRCVNFVAPNVMIGPTIASDVTLNPNIAIFVYRWVWCNVLISVQQVGIHYVKYADLTPRAMS